MGVLKKSKAHFAKIVVFKNKLCQLVCAPMVRPRRRKPRRLTASPVESEHPVEEINYYFLP